MVARVGFFGQDEVAVSEALSGILHYERNKDFVALCNGKKLNYLADPQSILEDKGNLVRELKICKRCQKKLGASSSRVAK